MFFFFNDTATTEIYTLSLHDALPISKEDLVGNTLLFLFNLLNWALRLSIAFVVYITLLVSGENLKIGIIQSQFVYHDLREFGYFSDHFSLTASKFCLACSSDPDK